MTLGIPVASLKEAHYLFGLFSAGFSLSGTLANGRKKP
jgi:hypothetical protein